MNGISVYEKELQRLPGPFHHVRTQSYWTADALILDFPALQNVKNNFFVCLSHLLYDIFVIASQRKKENCMSNKKKETDW